jgi:tape measure domain-containing protein
MADTITFGVKLTSSGGQAVAGEIKLPKKALDDLTGSEKRAGDQATKTGRQFAGLGAQGKKLWQANERVSKSLFSLKGALATVGVGALTKGVISATLALERSEAVMKALTGSSTLAGRELRFVAEEANRLGRSNANLRTQYAGLMAATRGTRLEGQATRELFTVLNESATVLGLTTDQNTRIMRAFQQIISKGRVSAEELRQQLGDSLPGAFQISARAMGVTTAELDKMLETGQLLSSEFIPKFTKQLHEEMGAGVADATQTSLASFNRLGNSIEALQISIGNSGLIDWLKEGADFLTNSYIPATKLALEQLGLLNTNFQTLTQDEAYARLGAAQQRQADLAERIAAQGQLGGGISTLDLQQLEETRLLIERLEERLGLLASAEDQAAVAASNLGLSIGHVAGQTDKQAKTAQALVDKLTDQANTIGLTQEQLTAYRLELLGADEATINHARGLARHVTAQQAAARADKKREDALRRQREAAKQAKKSDDDLVRSLKDELALMNLGSRAREIEIELRKLSAEATKEQRDEVRELAGAIADSRAVVDQAADDAKNFEKAWDRSLERIDDLFVDLWRNAMDGANNFGDTLKDWFKDLLANLAHQALTQQIAIQFAGAFSSNGTGSGGGLSSLFNGGGGSGGGSGFGNTGVSSIGNLFSGSINNLAGDGLRYLGGLAGNAGFTGTQQFLNSGVTNLNNAGSALGTSFATGAAGFAGNFGANALFGDDRGAGADIGGAVGTAIGSIWGPLGAAVGGFLGNSVGGLFGGGEPSPPKFHVRGSANPFSAGTDNQGNARTVEGFGALGGIQFSAQHIADDDSFLGNQPFIDSVVALDNQIAGMLSDRALELARSAAESFTFDSEGSVDIGSVLRNRAQVIGGGIGAIGGIDQSISRALTLGTSFEQLQEDLSLIAALSGDAAGPTQALADGIEAIDLKFAGLTERAADLGLPLSRLNDLREAEKRQLEQTLGLGGVRDLLTSLSATGASPLDQQTVLGNANQLYLDTLRASEAGDQLALNQLAGVSSNLIGQLESMFSHGETFFEGVLSRPDGGFSTIGMRPLEADVVGFNQIKADLERLLGIPGFDQGGISTGLGFVHANEGVVPLDGNRAIGVTLNPGLVEPVVRAIEISQDSAAANDEVREGLMLQMIAELRLNNKLLREASQRRAVAR